MPLKKISVLTTILVFFALVEGGIHRYTRPPFEAWLQGKISGYSIDFKDNKYDTTISGLGVGAGASLNLISVFNGFKNTSTFPERINIFATISIEKLPTRTIQGTSYEDTIFGSWRREIDATVNYTPLNINFGPDVKINLLPFIDIFGSFAFTLQYDICVYERIEDEYLISDGTHTGHSIYSEISKNKGFGIQAGYGGELYWPSFPSLKLGFQIRHSFLNRPFFSDINWETSHFGGVKVSNRSFQPSFYVTYSMQRVNKDWLAHREAISNFKRFLCRTRSIEKMTIEGIYSEIMNLEKLHSALKTSEPTLDSKYSIYKSQLYTEWVIRNLALFDDGTASSFKQNELNDLKSQISEICCQGIIGDNNKTAQLQYRIEQAFSKIANDQKRMQDSLQHYNDSVSFVVQSENERKMLLGVEALRKKGTDLSKEKNYFNAIEYLDKFISKYSELSENQKSIIDTSGIFIEIAKIQYEIGNYYLQQDRTGENILQAQKWFRESLLNGYKGAMNGLTQCRIDSRPTSIKFKGFFIGISSSDAIDLIEDRYSSIFGKPIIKKYEGEEAGVEYVMETKNGGKFLFDNYLRLIKLYLSEEIVNSLFNVSDLSAEQFAQEFVNSYDIPRMEAGSDVTSEGIAAAAMQYWEYISKDGVRLRIYGPGQGSVFGFLFTFTGKNMRLEKVPTRSKRSFD